MIIQEGDILTLKNKEYIVVNKLKYNDNDYVYLISNFKPIEIMISKLTIINGNALLQEEDDKEIIRELLKLVSKDSWAIFFCVNLTKI